MTMPRNIITTHDQDDRLTELAHRYDSLKVSAADHGAIVVECGKWFPMRFGGHDYEPQARYIIDEDGGMTGSWLDRRGGSRTPAGSRLGLRIQ